MALSLTGERLTFMHTAPAADASLKGARLTFMHTAPAADASLKGTRLTFMHDVPLLNASLKGTRLTFMHDVPPVPGLYTSPSDAIEDLPNSGASSPFKSNRDAARALK